MKKEKNTAEVPASKDDKSKALATAISQIQKEFGKGSIMRLSDNANMNVESIPTGSLGLDFALGVGGIPKGRIVEIYGPEASGKTTLALHCVAETQKRGGTAAYVDAEHALDPAYAKNLGVDTDALLIAQPDTGEQGLEICEQLVRSGAIDIVIVDSVAALVPRAEIDGDMGDAFVGLHARLMSQALRKLAGVVAKTNCIVIFINQLRSKIGVMYGNPETTTGGNALKFYASVRIDVRKVQTIKTGTEVVGSHTRVKVVKNKVAPPFRTAEFDILYGKGISKMSELSTMGLNYGFIEKSGSWFTLNLPDGGAERFHGEAEVRKYLEQNADVADWLEEQAREKLRGGNTLVLSDEVGDGEESFEDEEEQYIIEPAVCARMEMTI